MKLKDFCKTAEAKKMSNVDIAKKFGVSHVSVFYARMNDQERTEWKSRKSEWRKIWFNKLRVEVLQHYGGSPPKCACCGESNAVFLCIDHINGRGERHRKKIKRQSIQIALKKAGYPEGYQVLCYNCNNGKHLCGVCPHMLFRFHGRLGIMEIRSSLKK